MAGTCVDHDHLREPLNKSRAGATTAMRDGMRERRRRECDREGWSSTFRRKMATPQRDARPQSIHNRGRRIPLRCPIPLRGPLEQRSGGALR